MNGGELNSAVNVEQGALLDEDYDSECGLTKPTFDLGAGFMSGMPGGKFACAEIEVFAMKPQA